MVKDIVKPITNQVNISRIWTQILLYCWVVSQHLSYSEFKWLNKQEIDKFDVNTIGKNSLDGYILYVDVKHPDELHELHND